MLFLNGFVFMSIYFLQKGFIRYKQILLKFTLINIEKYTGINQRKMNSKNTVIEVPLVCMNH